MAFCQGCGKIDWSPVGCKCAKAPDLRALVEQAREQTRARAQAERFPPPPPVQLVLPDEPERPGLRSLVDASAECHRGRGHTDLYEARIAVARARRRGDVATLSTSPCADCGRYHVRVTPGG